MAYDDDMNLQEQLESYERYFLCIWSKEYGWNIIGKSGFKTESECYEYHKNITMSKIPRVWKIIKRRVTFEIVEESNITEKDIL